MGEFNLLPFLLFKSECRKIILSEYLGCKQICGNSGLNLEFRPIMLLFQQMLSSFGEPSLGRWVDRVFGAGLLTQRTAYD